MDQNSYGGFSIALRLGQALQVQPFRNKREEILSSFLAKYSTTASDILILLEALGLHYRDDNTPTTSAKAPQKKKTAATTSVLGSVDEVAAHIAKTLEIKTLSGEPGCPLAGDYAAHGNLQLKEAVQFIRRYRSWILNHSETPTPPAAAAMVTKEEIMTVIRACSENEFELLCCVIHGGSSHSALVGLTSVKEFLSVILSPAAMESYEEENEDIELALATACGEGSPRAALERDPTLNHHASDDVFDGLLSAVGGGVGGASSSTKGASALGRSSGRLSAAGGGGTETAADGGLLRFRTESFQLKAAAPLLLVPSPVIEDEGGENSSGGGGVIVKDFLGEEDDDDHDDGDDDASPPTKGRRLEDDKKTAAEAGAGGRGRGGGGAAVKRKHPCMYGAKCKRKNPDHWARYDHPPDHPKFAGAGAAKGGGVGGGRGEAAALVPSPVETTVGSTTTTRGGDGGAARAGGAPPAAKKKELDPKDFAINGVAPLRAMPLHEFIYVEGATGTYKMKNCGDGTYSCTCAVWRFQNRGTNVRTCKHLREYLGEEFERARCSEGDDEPLGGGIGGGGGGKAVPKAAPGGTKKHAMKGVLLANKATPGLGYDGYWVSEKLDGIRAFWDGKRLMTRNGNEIFAPDWFLACLPKDHQLDGELFGGRKKFQYTSSVYRSSPSAPGWKTLTYEVFDIPSLADQPFEARQAAMEKMFPKNRDMDAAPSSRHVHVVEQEKCTGKAYLDAKLQEVEALGGEGLMLRQAGSKYVHSRSNTLLKVKSTEEQDALVIGYDAGKGRLTASVGALRCELANKKQFSVGSGLNDAIRAKPPAIGTVITVKYQELTDGGIPRFPVFVGCRYDIDWPPADGGARKVK